MPRSKANQAARNNAQEQGTVSLGVTVGFLGSILVTLGFIVQNFADAIVISELKENEQRNSSTSSKKEKNNSSISAKQLDDIQRKLDLLINEMETLKKRG